MRRSTAAVLIILIGLGSSHLAAEQTPPRTRACSILTRELALQFSTADGKRVVDLIKPVEEQAGPNGSSCQVGRISLRLDPFPKPEQVRKTMGKDWEPVPGVGDAAFFKGDSSFANLYVWSGSRHFAIQMGVGPGGASAALKSNVTGLANAVIPKLK